MDNDTSTGNCWLRMVLPIVVGLGLVGCTNAPAPQQDGNVQFTEVTFANGKPVVRTRTLTPVQAKAQTDWIHEDFAARTGGKGTGVAIPDIELDTACNGASDWLYDQTYEGGNRICFDNAGGPVEISLVNYSDTSPDPSTQCWYDTWWGCVRSMWTGNYLTAMYNYDKSCVGGTEPTYTKFDTVDSCEQSSYWLDVGIN